MQDEFGQPINFSNPDWTRVARARFRAEIERLRAENAALREEVQRAKISNPDTIRLQDLRHQIQELEKQRVAALAVLDRKS
jgi:hypothetical protein